MPCAALLMELKVAGQTTIVVGSGPRFGSPGFRYSTRTSLPVCRRRASVSSHANAARVATTATDHPAACTAAATSTVRVANGAPVTTNDRCLGTGGAVNDARTRREFP